MATINLKERETYNAESGNDGDTFVMPLVAKLSGLDRWPIGVRSLSATSITVTMQRGALSEGMFDARNGTAYQSVDVTLAPNETAFFFWRSSKGWVFDRAPDWSNVTFGVALP